MLWHFHSVVWHKIPLKCWRSLLESNAISNSNARNSKWCPSIFLNQSMYNVGDFWMPLDCIKTITNLWYYQTVCNCATYKIVCFATNVLFSFQHRSWSYLIDFCYQFSMPVLHECFVRRLKMNALCGSYSQRFNYSIEMLTFFTLLQDLLVNSPFTSIKLHLFSPAQIYWINLISYFQNYFQNFLYKFQFSNILLSA